MNGHHDLVSLFSQPKLELHHAIILAILYQIILKINFVNSQLVQLRYLCDKCIVIFQSVIVRDIYSTYIIKEQQIVVF